MYFHDCKILLLLLYFWCKNVKTWRLNMLTVVKMKFIAAQNFISTLSDINHYSKFFKIYRKWDMTQPWSLQAHTHTHISNNNLSPLIKPPILHTIYLISQFTPTYINIYSIIHAFLFSKLSPLITVIDGRMFWHCLELIGLSFWGFKNSFVLH